MRQISFSMTTDQVNAQAKDVTRRLGWENVKVGEQLQAIEKGQGLKKGEKVVKLCVIEVASVKREPLSAMKVYGQIECKREGFPDMTPEQFIRMFCIANRCDADLIVTRIEFRYVNPRTERTAITALNPNLAWPFPVSFPGDKDTLQ